MTITLPYPLFCRFYWPNVLDDCSGLALQWCGVDHAGGVLTIDIA